MCSFGKSYGLFAFYIANLMFSLDNNLDLCFN